MWVPVKALRFGKQHNTIKWGGKKVKAKITNKEKIKINMQIIYYFKLFILISINFLVSHFCSFHYYMIIRFPLPVRGWIETCRIWILNWSIVDAIPSETYDNENGYHYNIHSAHLHISLSQSIMCLCYTGNSTNAKPPVPKQINDFQIMLC